MIPGYPSVLVTGAAGGFGYYAAEQAGAVGWTRAFPDKTSRDRLKREGVDLIIHSAVNHTRSIDVSSENLFGYYRDNVALTEEVVAIPHRRFVQISTCAVYPPEFELFEEGQVIPVDRLEGVYAITKLMAESIVRARATRPLILRVVALLGPRSRKSSALKIVEDEPCRLTLAGDSQMNFLLHSDLYRFIQAAIAQEADGIYNVAASANLSLQELAERLGKTVEFGSYRLDVGRIDTRRARAILPELEQDSWQVFRRYLSERNSY